MRKLGVRAPGRTVVVEDLSTRLQERRARRSGTLHSALRQRETEIVQDALERHDRILARAAAELGITRQALWLKVRRLGLVVAGP
jgi:transcriptional regulator with PAS, ATPase and Fis domain